MRKRKKAARQCIELACILRNGNYGCEEAATSVIIDVVDRLATIAETLGMDAMLIDALLEGAR